MKSRDSYSKIQIPKSKFRPRSRIFAPQQRPILFRAPPKNDVTLSAAQRNRRASIYFCAGKAGWLLVEPSRSPPQIKGSAKNAEIRKMRSLPFSRPILFLAPPKNDVTLSAAQRNRRASIYFCARKAGWLLAEPSRSQTQIKGSAKSAEIREMRSLPFQRPILFRAPPKNDVTLSAAQRNRRASIYFCAGKTGWLLVEPSRSPPQIKGSAKNAKIREMQSSLFRVFRGPKKFSPAWITPGARDGSSFAAAADRAPLSTPSSNRS